MIFVCFSYDYGLPPGPQDAIVTNEGLGWDSRSLSNGGWNPLAGRPRNPKKKITSMHQWLDFWTKNIRFCTPWKIKHGFHNHGGLVQIIFLSKCLICRFQPLIFQGVSQANQPPLTANSWACDSIVVEAFDLKNQGSQSNDSSASGSQ